MSTTPPPPPQGSAYPETQRSTRSPRFLPNNPSLLDALPAIMNYVHPSVETAHIRRDTTGSDNSIQDVSWDPQPVWVQNARNHPSMTLHPHGFQLVENENTKNIDFWDSQNVLQNYYPQCEALLQEVLSSSDDNSKRKNVLVKAFDHNVRVAAAATDSDDTTDDAKTLKNGRGAQVQTPLAIVHGDYTAVSAPKRLHDLTQPPKVNDVYYQDNTDSQPLLDPAVVQPALAGRRRFAFINVWRSIDPDVPIQTMPLACVNAQTVTRSDLRTLQIHYTDRVGENYLPTIGKHEWMFVPDMTQKEVLLIKQWDSYGAMARGQERDDADCCTFCLHSAFLEPAQENPPRPRKSIEVRCVCIWEED